MIEFPCLNCGKYLRVSDTKAGKKGKCPGCGNILHVPPATAASDRETGEAPASEKPRPDVPRRKSTAGTPGGRQGSMMKLALAGVAVVLAVGGVVAWRVMFPGGQIDGNSSEASGQPTVADNHNLPAPPHVVKNTPGGAQPERGARAESRPGGTVSAKPAGATATSRLAMLADGKFVPGKVKLKIETIAMVPAGARYLRVSPDLGRMACYYVSNGKAVPFICGEKGDPGDLLKNAALLQPTSRPASRPRDYRPLARPLSSGNRYRSTSRPASRSTTRPRYYPVNRRRTSSGSPRSERAHCIFSADSREQLFVIYTSTTSDGKDYRAGWSDARIRWKGRDTKAYSELAWVGISPDGKHYSCVARDIHGCWMAILDGREVALTGLPKSSPSDTTYGFGRHTPYIFFSPDRTRFIHIVGAKIGDKYVKQVYADNKYVSNCGSSFPGVKWSGDSKRYAYFSVEGFIIDGKEVKKCHGALTKSLVFSDDGKHWAFVASGDKARTMRYPGTTRRFLDQFVVHDGAEGKHYAKIIDVGSGLYSSGPQRPVFTPDGEVVHNAIICYEHSEDGRGSRWRSRVVTISGGREIEPLLVHKRPVAFSEDRKHHAYLGAPGGVQPGAMIEYMSDLEMQRLRASRQCVIVHDGRQGRTFNGYLYNPLISPDGRHAAAWFVPGTYRRRGAKMSLVVDDIELPTNFKTGDGGRLKYVNSTTLHAAFGLPRINRLFKFTLEAVEPIVLSDLPARDIGAEGRKTLAVLKKIASTFDDARFKLHTSKSARDVHLRYGDVAGAFALLDNRSPGNLLNLLSDAVVAEVRAKRLESARKLADTALARFKLIGAREQPENYACVQAVARAYAALGDAAKSREILAVGRGISQRIVAFTNISMANICERSGHLDEAMMFLGDLGDYGEPLRRKLLLEIAQKYEDSGDLKTAAKVYRRLLKGVVLPRQRGRSSAQGVQAIIGGIFGLIRCGDRGGAIAFVSAIPHDDPARSWLLVEVSRSCTAARRRDIFRKAGCLLLAAEMEIHAGNMKAAAADLKRVLDALPPLDRKILAAAKLRATPAQVASRRVSLLNRIAWALLSAGAKSDAEKVFARARALVSTHSVTRVNSKWPLRRPVGLLAYDGKFDEAMKLAKTSGLPVTYSERSIGHVIVYEHCLGVIARRKEIEDWALEYSRVVPLSYKPYQAGSWASLLLVEAARAGHGDVVDAAIDKIDTRTLLMVVDACAQQGKTDEVAKYLKQAVAKAKADTKYQATFRGYYEISKLYVKYGMTDKALKLIELTWSIIPRQNSSYLHTNKKKMLVVLQAASGDLVGALARVKKLYVSYGIQAVSALCDFYVTGEIPTEIDRTITTVRRKRIHRLASYMPWYSSLSYAESPPAIMP